MTTPTDPPPYATPRPYEVTSDDQRALMAAKGRRAIIFGVLWIVFGIAVSAFTYSRAAAVGGGSYLLVWGPVVYGLIRIFQGWRQLARSRE